jgi:hypothetical protein
LLRGGRDGGIAVMASGKRRHQQVSYDERRLQTRGLCDWKCMFLQWIAGSIFLNCGHPEKHNKINGLDAVILRKGAGV